MKVTCFSQAYDCTKAVKNGDRATLYLTDGGTIEFVGVSDFAQFQISGGRWEAADPTELERLRADLDYISVMTGVTL